MIEQERAVSVSGNRKLRAFQARMERAKEESTNYTNETELHEEKSPQIAQIQKQTESRTDWK